ncbi:MAG: poly-gamma-glutamate biosynthesis protein PgsC/CapC [Synergistaceae bacterium]
MTDNITLTLALGIALSMIWEKRTGFASGGLIAPGVAALTLYDPYRLLLGLGLSFAVWIIMELLSRRFTVYGRQRIGMAMLIALALRVLTGHFSPDPLWFGWVVPGLIASDIQRQGVVETVSSLLIVAAAAAFTMEIIYLTIPFAAVL